MSSADDPDEYYATRINFNFTIMAIFAWLVPTVGIEMGKYRSALLTSPDWNNNNNKQQAGETNKLELGLRAVRNAGGLAIVVALVVIIDLSILISLLTQDLDNRMYSILHQGLSRLFGALVMYVISIMSPKWFGVYFYKATYNHNHMVTVGKSLQVVRFNVAWGILRQFGRCGFFLLPFFCGVHAITIPVSMIAGVVSGFAVDACVFLARKRNETQRTYIAAITAVSIALLSAVLFSEGVWYIAVVWGREKNKEKRSMIITAAFCAWALAGILVHVILYLNAKRKFAQYDHDSIPAHHDVNNGNANNANTTRAIRRPGLDTAMSMISSYFSQRREGGEDQEEQKR
jgi:hypothetical protein